MDPATRQAAQRAERLRLIKSNRSAPADRVIRSLFKHFQNIRDDEDGAVIETPEEAIELWYGVDDLVLVFDNKTTAPVRGQCDYFIRLIHQGHCAKPTIEDVSDYTASLDQTAIAPLLSEATYPPRYQM